MEGEEHGNESILGQKAVLMAVSWAGGIFGLDRFYHQQIGWGILKLITFGGVYVWWFFTVSVSLGWFLMYCLTSC